MKYIPIFFLTGLAYIIAAPVFLYCLFLMIFHWDSKKCKWYDKFFDNLIKSCKY